jgi:hypothetical protein
MSVAFRFNASASLKRLVTSPVFIRRPDEEFETFVSFPVTCLTSIVSSHRKRSVSSNANLSAGQIQGGVVDLEGDYNIINQLEDQFNGQ